ncbi:hypothetical protein BO79DRAFT_208551 [Aspergillus costaricaensis CBS 115574]|uniref:Uncharacterized protein n=1 Tax=Aspergillus costaricaensis CBS 115574 TaxID=1448317 RepID=A0ACD1IJ13_9EURO|nr:hypothetical protein BO79DRAFT_208551 [Aspergillus costaricaensis CBS 115574]RAK89782.1 hypothetical protein BO79DRAFT_208551 [Aspergillus costaricaensis CBS 115574]
MGKPSRHATDGRDPLRTSGYQVPRRKNNVPGCRRNTFHKRSTIYKDPSHPIWQSIVTPASSSVQSTSSPSHLPEKLIGLFYYLYFYLLHPA